jgi:adenylate cyclase
MNPTDTVTRLYRWVDSYDEPGAGGAAQKSGEVLVEETGRRLFWSGWIANGAGMLVAVASIAFLIPVFLDAGDLDEIFLLNGPLLVAYFIACGVLISRTLFRAQAEACAWLEEERVPSEREHRLALRLPLKNAAATGFAWGVGGVLFAALNLTHSLGLAAVVGAVAWLGGETTSAIAYLVSERILRPITARALAVRVPRTPVAPGVRVRLLFAWALGTGAPLLGVLVVGVVGLTKSGVDTQYVAAAALFLGVVSMAVGLLATLFVAHAIADPVTSVRTALERVERGDLEVNVPVDDGSEVGQLQAGFNRMVEGLRERERLRDLFGRQVGEDVARAALKNGTKLGGEEREVGALFVDVTGSTSMALAMPPTEVVRLLNLFFREVIEVVEAHGGLVSKFEGDAALCIFGTPVARDDPAGDALRAARELSERLSREVRQIDFGIGVSAGRAVAGNVGSEQRFEYTVIGDPVNEAARLCELAKRQPGRVLASEAALRRATGKESGAWSVDGSEVLRGRERATGLARPRS